MVKRFTMGFVCGYLVGARSGRERYDQLADVGRKVMDIPAVRDVVSSGQDRARDLGQRVVEAVQGAVSADDVDDDVDQTPDDRDLGRDEADDFDTGTEHGTEPETGTRSEGSTRGSGADESRRPRQRGGKNASQAGRDTRHDGRGRPTRNRSGGAPRKANRGSERTHTPSRTGRSGLARVAATALERGRTD